MIHDIFLNQKEHHICEAFFLTKALLRLKQEWPEEVYPPYANGPGYIISNDIARFITSQYANQSLRV